MGQYNGFSTINADKPRTTNAAYGIAGGPGTTTNPIIPGKKYKLTDSNLVVRDFINALNIRQGEKVGQPQYGTTLWDFVFEPNTSDVQFALEQEIRRIAALDPRIIINTCRAFPQENGILLELEIAVAPFNEASLLSLFFDSNTNTVSV